MTQGLPAHSISCERCNAAAICVLTHFVEQTPHAAPLCERCWLALRQVVGAELIEGPITWGTDWQEVVAWLDRTLAHARTRRMRQLTAVELARQVPHLPVPMPLGARELLDEFGLDTS